jgi:Autographiviridae endonuclease VII
MKKPKPNPSLVRRSDAQERELAKKYGISEDQYQQILELQRGVCAICERHQRYRRLSVDHDHKTKRVRGLLCNWCNRSIGRFFDSPIRLRKAAEYLETFESKLSNIIKVSSSPLVS